MNGLEFLATSDAQTLLDRAATVAGVPVSVHTYASGRESELAWSCGGCAACAYVNALPWGPQFCRRSRAKPAAAAMARARPVPFLCHVQFPCVIVPALLDAPETAAIAFGPYCPREAPGSLARDALARLPDVAQTPFETLPFTLDDVPLADARAVYAAAEWTAESLTARYCDRCAAEEPDEARADAPNAYPAIRRYPRAYRDPYQGADLLAALAAGDTARFRTLVATVLDDGAAPPRTRLDSLCGRALAIAGAVLEAAARAGYDTATSWARLPEFAEHARAAESHDAIAAALRDALRDLRRNAPREQASLRDFPALYRAVWNGLDDGVTLERVAEELGENASTLTKRLQRGLGMSFSEYKGRVRVDRAKALLRQTQLSVAEIAVRVGIDDASNFRRLFRQHEGVSPSKYRARRRG